jgi:adenylate cyclase
MAEARVERRLAAILAADVAGYSRLMGNDEIGTLAALKAYRREIVDPAIAAHHGRIVKTTGDGMLVEFASAVDAVTCAVKVQEKMAERVAGAAGPPILLRVGINVGDIIVDDDDIFGDGVNVAARVENECEPGGIYLSGTAFEQVRGKTSFAFDELGERALKNIDRPVRLYSARLAGSSAATSPSLPSETARPLPVPDRPSIAVLAFQNMSGDPEQEYFSDGITEDIITGLSQNHGIFVIARNSSYTYKGQAVDVRRIGRELGVRYVLEGSVRRAGERVRITGQLTEAERRAHIWAGRYDRELTDIFAVQDEITRSIVATVAPEMLEAEMRRVRRKEPQTLGAWECAMRAQWHLERLTREDLVEAHRLAAQATVLDPGASLGFNIDAFTHIHEVTYGWSTSALQSVLAAYQAATKAVALDSRDAASQSALGCCEVLMRRTDDAIARLKVAIDLNPNLTWAHANLGLALASSGRGDEAVAPLSEALRLSPRAQNNFMYHHLMGFALFVAGRYQEGLASADTSLRENSGLPGAHRVRAACLSQLGRIDEAKAAFAEFLRLAPDATVTSIKAQVPLKRPEDLERYIDALKRAGLRDS